MRGPPTYWLVGHDNEGRYGVAEGDELLAASLTVRLEPQAWMRDWEPIDIELVEGEFTDYLETHLPLRLCSVRMRGLINTFRAIPDRLQWLPVRVHQGEETRDYAALHLLRSPSWLDAGHSRYKDGELIRPVVNRELAGGRRVLAPLHDIVTWFVDDELVEEMEESRMTGIVFYEVETV